MNLPRYWKIYFGLLVLYGVGMGFWLLSGSLFPAGKGIQLTALSRVILFIPWILFYFSLLVTPSLGVLYLVYAGIKTFQYLPPREAMTNALLWGLTFPVLGMIFPFVLGFVYPCRGGEACLVWLLYLGYAAANLVIGITVFAVVFSKYRKVVRTTSG